MATKKMVILVCMYAVCFVYIGGWAGQLLNQRLNLWPNLRSPKPYQDLVPSQAKDESLTTNWSRVLVMSSVGRSGSSFLGELLSQYPNSFYIFEPVHYLQVEAIEDVTAEDSRELLENLYNCQFDQEWVNWALKRSKMIGDLSIQEFCGYRVGIASYSKCLLEACLRSSPKIFKVIRMRVAWVKEMLQINDSSLKVIHLVRDPRGSFASLDNLKMAQKNYSVWCPKIQEDLELVRSMETLFPRTFLSIRYEDLCLDPPGTAGKLWRFLMERNTIELPDYWKTYLEKHISKGNNLQFGTKRDSRKEAEAWRLEISEGTLKGVEWDCAEVLRLLGYNAFGSLKNVRNLSIPLKRLAV